MSELPDHFIFRGSEEPHDGIVRLPAPPPWRRFGTDELIQKGKGYQAAPGEIEAVNAAMMLRRPLLITGKAGLGKSTLAYAIAYELGLGDVLVWPITTRSTLREGQYSYDAIGRLHEEARAAERFKVKNQYEPVDIGRFVSLGPLGTAMLGTKKDDQVLPRVLLIDEIDKSDIDLPNDLLNIFEEGRFEIPELARLPEDEQDVTLRPYKSKTPVQVHKGVIVAEAFPIVIMTSNGERDFPPAFLRRCLRINLEYPDAEKLKRIVEQRLAPPEHMSKPVDDLVQEFVRRRDEGNELSTDQLLNAVNLLMNDVDPMKREALLEVLLRPLIET